MSRPLNRVIPSQTTSDGAGVKLRRSIGAADGLRLDPFLMLDEFGTDRPEDYIAGFPPHPHRDMEIVTYVIDGAIRHEDDMGNGSVIRAGEVQLMSAGSGVVHSEHNAHATADLHLLQMWQP